MTNHHEKSVRAATLADLETVASWLTSVEACELWAGWRVSYPVRLSTLPEAIAFAESDALAVTDQGELLAFGQLVLKEARRGHLARLIVAPPLRGRGYGEELVRALLDRARVLSCERVSLNVAESNAPALALYAKLGFCDAGRPSDEPAAAGSRYMECVSLR